MVGFPEVAYSVTAKSRVVCEVAKPPETSQFASEIALIWVPVILLAEFVESDSERHASCSFVAQFVQVSLPEMAELYCQVPALFLATDLHVA